MSKSIESRITALAEALQRRQMEQAAPVDGLSRSLFNLQQEFSTLDDEGKAALLEALNNPDDGEGGSLKLTMQDIEQFLADYGGKDNLK